MDGIAPSTNSSLKLWGRGIRFEFTFRLIVELIPIDMTSNEHDDSEYNE